MTDMKSMRIDITRNTEDDDQIVDDVQFRFYKNDEQVSIDELGVDEIRSIAAVVNSFAQAYEKNEIE